MIPARTRRTRSLKIGPKLCFNSTQQKSVTVYGRSQICHADATQLELVSLSWLMTHPVEVQTSFMDSDA